MKAQSMLRFFALAVVGVSLASTIHAQILTNDPSVSGYFSVPNGKKYSSGVIYAQILLNSETQITNAGSELALFDGTNCAGYTTIVSGPVSGGVEFMLTAYADVSPGSTIKFQFWNSGTSLLYTTNIASTYTFQSGIGMGSITSPIVLTATASVPEPTPYALIGIGSLGLLLVNRRKKTA